jgi:hypothetical protein
MKLGREIASDTDCRSPARSGVKSRSTILSPLDDSCGVPFHLPSGPCLSPQYGWARNKQVIRLSTCLPAASSSQETHCQSPSLSRADRSSRIPSAFASRTCIANLLRQCTSSHIRSNTNIATSPHNVESAAFPLISLTRISRVLSGPRLPWEHEQRGRIGRRMCAAG